MTTIDKIRDASNTIDTQQQSTFDGLAKSVADNSQLDPDDVASTLHAIGRSAEDLADAASSPNRLRAVVGSFD